MSGAVRVIEPAGWGWTWRIEGQTSLIEITRGVGGLDAEQGWCFTRWGAERRSGRALAIRLEVDERVAATRRRLMGGLGG